MQAICVVRDVSWFNAIQFGGRHAKMGPTIPLYRCTIFLSIKYLLHSKLLDFYIHHISDINENKLSKKKKIKKNYRTNIAADTLVYTVLYCCEIWIVHVLIITCGQSTFIYFNLADMD